MRARYTWLYGERGSASEGIAQQWYYMAHRAQKKARKEECLKPRLAN